MTKGLVLYLVFGVGTTVLLFLFHKIGCPYDMNPLCFLECVSPLVLCAPLAMFSDNDWDR